MRHVTTSVVVGVLLLFALAPASWAGNFFDVADNGNVGIGTASAGALLDVARPDTTSNAELIDIRANGFTQTISSGLTNARFNLFNQYTLSAASAQTVTNGTTLYIAGPPTASGAGPATITAGSALRIAGGTVANTTNAYGLYVDAPTGATNNYGAVFASGNVGIGTTSPQNALHVRSSGVQQLVLEGNSSWTQMGMKWSTNNFWTIGIAAAGANNFYIVDQNATYRFGIDGSGNFCLACSGGYSTSQAIDTKTGAYLSQGGAWTNASSREYKQDITNLTRENAVEALKRLNPVTFRYKRSPEERHVGFIAEDVPDLVASHDRKGLSAMDIVAVLTKVLQEQQNEIDELKAQVNAKK